MDINQSDASKLKIILWNANGLKQNETELLNLLLEKQIDIALITETHCKPNIKLYFPGFQIYRADHPDGTAHAGSAIIISSKIQHQLISYIQIPTLQSTTVQITIKHIPIKISSAYFPPRPSITSRQLDNFFQSLGQHFLVGGDFNSKHSHWGCISENSRGKMLHKIINNNACSFISPDGPTYWPLHEHRHPDILDFFISKLPQHINHSITNLCELSSDHTPVLLTINETPKLNPSHTSLSQGPVNWDKFSEIMHNNTNLQLSLKTNEEIENATQDLITSIQSAVYESSHKNSQSNQQNLYNQLLPTHITDLISLKRRTRSQYQKYRYPSDKQTFNRLSNTIKKLILKYKSKCFEEKYQILNTKDCSLWKTTKSLLNKREQLPPLTGPNGSLAITDKDKADLFGEHLFNIFTPHPDILPDQEHLNKIDQFLDSPLPVPLPAKPTTPNEIQFLIKKLKEGKSPGYDLISNKILKKLPKKSLVLITYIFNSMLRLSYFPLIWKLSTIILIPKPNKPKNLVTSYRPISLLPTLAKLFEKVILSRIRPILQAQNIIPNSQFGFRARHSTIHQIHRLTDLISASLEKKQFCPAVFLDVSQAFDRVWHKGLLYKLKHFLPAPYYLIIKSYLENRTFVVRQFNNYSSYFCIQAGVPQGSDLSPDLFNIFTADMPSSTNTIMATYADDTAILCPGNDPVQTSNSLQNHLKLIENWSSKWRIKINPEKSVHVNFTLKKSECSPLNFQGTPIPTSSDVKYLGIILDKRLTWGPHLKAKRKKLNSRLHILRPILKSKMSIHTKNIVYKSLIRPVWAYAIQIWGCAKPSQLRTIQAFQSIALRLVTSAPWYISNDTLHNDLKIETIRQLATKHYSKFHSKLSTHHNPLISSLSCNSLPGNPMRRLKREWCRDLLQ